MKHSRRVQIMLQCVVEWREIQIVSHPRIVVSLVATIRLVSHGKRIRLLQDDNVFMDMKILILNAPSWIRRISVDFKGGDEKNLQIPRFVRIISSPPLSSSLIKIGVQWMCLMISYHPEQTSQMILQTSNKDIFREMLVGTENISHYPRSGVKMVERLTYDLKVLFITPPHS